MPSIDKNREVWGAPSRWLQGGDKWSEWWGTPRAQWTGCLLPRIFPFLKGRILEIAPGHGRWTQFLEVHCTSLIGIDLNPSCVEICKHRFENHANLEFKSNDGLTLPMVEDASIDFAFSFDSLVHAEADVVSSYVRELARVLKPGGVAFLHHSNFGAARYIVWENARRLILRPPHQAWRASSMSAKKMREFAESSGMTCAQQEIVPWGTRWPLMIDCMSTLVNTPGGPSVVVENPRFMEEAAVIKRISSLV
jgi:ubiquinone/menaquinone biosynthesis C-methylase UbiE